MTSEEFYELVEQEDCVIQATNKYNIRASDIEDDDELKELVLTLERYAFDSDFVAWWTKLKKYINDNYINTF